MEMRQERIYTETDYYNLPENVRAELIDGKIYSQAAPSRIHQRILSEVHTVINNYIKSKGGSCEVYPAPFAVKLFIDRKTIVEPDISVICDRGKLTDKGCTGAPDWIIEIISPITSRHDYIRKLNLYADAGVQLSSSLLIYLLSFLSPDGICDPMGFNTAKAIYQYTICQHTICTAK